MLHFKNSKEMFKISAALPARRLACALTGLPFPRRTEQGTVSELPTPEDAAKPVSMIPCGHQGGDQTDRIP